MKIRAASRADRAAIRALVQMHPKQVMQSHIPETKFFFVAEEGNAIVGCCALEVYSKKIAEIRTLSVHKNFHGRGTAKKLVAACVARAKKQRIHEVLAITSAVNLFDKFGFKTFNKEKWALIRLMR